MSLLRREYLSLEVNVLRNSLKILDSTNIDFFQMNFVDREKNYGKGSVLQISTVFGPVPHVSCRRVL